MRDVVTAVRGGGEASLGSAPVADAADQAARVDPGDPDEIAILQPSVQGAPGPPVGGGSNLLAQNQAAACGRARFDILVVGTHIPDVRESEGDDLARVGRIGEDLLVSGHRGVEAHFPEGLAEGAEAPPPEDRAVLQDQHGFPSCLDAGCDRCRLRIELHD
jgi:hypothetical protein